MTKDLDKYYGVTVYHAEKREPGKWRARGEIFRRGTLAVLKTFYVEGGAMTSADSRALSKAKHIVTSWGIPEDWQGPKEEF